MNSSEIGPKIQHSEPTNLKIKVLPSETLRSLFPMEILICEYSPHSPGGPECVEHGEDGPSVLIFRVNNRCARRIVMAVQP